MDLQKCLDDAHSLIDTLKKTPQAVGLDEAMALANSLRSHREFDLLTELTEELRKNGYEDPTIIKLQAQALIDRGQPRIAIDVLSALTAGMPSTHIEFSEANGLQGRAWKQIFFDKPDKSTPQARKALGKSFENYKLAYDAPVGDSVWPGVNLLALGAYANQQQISVATDIDREELSHALLRSLDATPISKQDNWYHASKAEAYLGLGDLDAVENEIGQYARSSDTTAFALGGTLRQFTDLWRLDQQSEKGRGIVQALRAALLARKNYGRLELGADDVRQALAERRPSEDQLQKILGVDGLRTYDWLINGLAMARSVGVIRDADGNRIATGFLLRGSDIIPSLGDERVVVTNAHVISDPREGEAISYEGAAITFEAVDKAHSYRFTKILWQSSIRNLDCALLRLREQPQTIEPLEIASDIPPILKNIGPGKRQARVYIIGYPGGRDLTFSLQDNELLDHEGPPDGRPPNRAVCRIQYHAPTEPGSSGSPVFDSWRVIALHHAGSEAMPRLNGRSDTWPANEGIWIQSIIAGARVTDIPKHD